MTGNGDHWGSGNADNPGWLKTFKAIITLALDRSPAQFVGVIALAAVALLLALVLGLVFAKQGREDLALAVVGMCVAVVGLAIIGLVVVMIVGSVRGAPTPGVSSVPSSAWARLVPKLPIDEEAQKELRERLGNIRMMAHAALQSECRDLDVKLEQVRSNVFFPDTPSVAKGICELAIPDGLHSGMVPDNGAPDGDWTREQALAETRIRFRLNQGLTGVVFLEGSPKQVKMQQEADGYQWPQKYHLTKAQEEVVHPRLRWIIAFPLKALDGSQERIMGVLNVDGLDHLPDDQALSAVLGKLMQPVLDFRGRLNRLSRQRIRVSIEDV